jgi:hypothetical protein
MVSRRKLTCLSGAMLLCGAVRAAEPAPLNATELVDEWLKRLNALADWTAEPEATQNVEKFVELYDSAVLQFTGPNEDQIGMATYSGHEGVRVWAARFGHAWSKSEYQIAVQTAQEKTAGLLHTAALPWGGTAVAMELLTIQTAREGKKKFAAPAAVFLQFNESGKISRARIYLLKDETVEIIA